MFVDIAMDIDVVNATLAIVDRGLYAINTTLAGLATSQRSYDYINAHPPKETCSICLCQFSQGYAYYDTGAYMCAWCESILSEFAIVGITDESGVVATSNTLLQYYDDARHAIARMYFIKRMDEQEHLMNDRCSCCRSLGILTCWEWTSADIDSELFSRYTCNHCSRGIRAYEDDLQRHLSIIMLVGVITELVDTRSVIRDYLYALA